MKETTLAAIVLTKNEECDLLACLESLKGLVTEIYVIDSGSTDRTVAIAEEYGARVLLASFHELRGTIQLGAGEHSFNGGVGASNRCG